ncbi:MAG TPA: transcriptional regulator [Candidatus Bathyarchaeia archaeon]|nr:transcriptional regulator [Candidatus Bathyarchaeia archaeon]
MASDDAANEGVQPIGGLDRVIHEPARLMIVAVLSAVESADFLFLARETGLTRGNLSTHLAKLEAAGYVDIRKEFVGKIPRTLARLTPAGRDALAAYAHAIRGALGRLSG